MYGEDREIVVKVSTESLKDKVIQTWNRWISVKIVEQMEERWKYEEQNDQKYKELHMKKERNLLKQRLNGWIENVQKLNFSREPDHELIFLFCQESNHESNGSAKTWK